MTELVTIEFINVPMKVAFSDKELLYKTARLFSDVPYGFKRLSCSERTFRQYMCLGGAQELDAEISGKIYQYMSEADQRNPYPITEVYPYLKEEKWELNMDSVSYMKVNVRFSGSEYKEVSRIRKTKSGELVFYPKGMCFQTKSESEILKIMKQIILEGTVDLDAVF